MKSIQRALILATLLAVLSPQVLFAQSLKERKMHAEAEESIQDDITRLKESCGASDIKFSFDWSNFDAEIAANNSIDGYCSEAVVAGIAGQCESDKLWKESVPKSIKTITCGFGKTRSIELKEGNLNYVVSFDSSNDRKYAVKYLEDNL